MFGSEWPYTRKSPASTVDLLLTICLPLASAIVTISRTFEVSTISTSVAVAEPSLRLMVSVCFALRARLSLIISLN